jgi:hypothetical protein
MRKNRNSKFDNITNLLETLRETPPREAEAAARGRAAFIEEAESLPQPVSPGTKRRLNLRRIYTQPRLRTLTISIILIVSVLGTGAITANAAQTALPGDQLYPLKIWIEGVRLSIAGDDQQRYNLHLEFAAERIEELESLDSDDRLLLSDDFFNDLDQHLEEAEHLISSAEGEFDDDHQLEDLHDQYDELEADDEHDTDLESEIEDHDGEDSEDDQSDPEPSSEDPEEDKPDDDWEGTPESETDRSTESEDGSPKESDEDGQPDAEEHEDEEVDDDEPDEEEPDDEEPDDEETEDDPDEDD